MKTIIAGILLFSSMSFANSVLLRSTTHVEFSPTPGTSTLTIDDQGEVRYLSPNSPTRDGEGVVLAYLTEAALNTIKAQIAELNPEAGLVDEDPEGPQCMDAPSVGMTAYQGDREIYFYSQESCHSFRMNDGGGYGLIEIMTGLEYLAN